MLLRILLLLLCLPVLASAAEAERAHTAGPTVRVYTPPLRMPVLGFARTLRVYLPPDYAGGDKRYPVLYMFDGQNLFDDATSYVGEWGVDEAMDALAREDGFAAIVVGIDHGNELRINELIPYWNVRFLPNAGAGFIDDVVHAIKPFVDANYRTQPDRAHTAILGSSLGGLSADYAIHRYPEVFTRAGVFSPSYWVADEVFDNARRTPLPGDSRVYLYMGGKEGEESVPQAARMSAILHAQPGGRDMVTLRIVPAAEHNEAAWRTEFPRAVRWLFGLPQRDVAKLLGDMEVINIAMQALASLDGPGGSYGVDQIGYDDARREWRLLVDRGGAAKSPRRVTVTIDEATGAVCARDPEGGDCLAKASAATELQAAREKREATAEAARNPPPDLQGVIAALVRYQATSADGYAKGGARTLYVSLHLPGVDRPVDIAPATVASLQDLDIGLHPGSAFVPPVDGAHGGDAMRMDIGLPRRRPDGDYDVDYGFWCGTLCASGHSAVLHHDSGGWKVVSSAMNSIS